MSGFKIDVGQLIAREIVANLEKSKSIYFPFVISGLMKPHFDEGIEDKETVGKILDPKAVKKIMTNQAGVAGATASAKEGEEEETESNEKTEEKAESVPASEPEEVSSIKLMAVKQEKGEAMAKAAKKKAAKPVIKGIRKSSRGAEKAFSENHKKMSEEGVINIDNSPPEVVVSQKNISPQASPIRTTEPIPPVTVSAASATAEPAAAAEAATAMTATSQEGKGEGKEPEEVNSGEKNKEENAMPQREGTEKMEIVTTAAEEEALENIIAAITTPEASKEKPVEEKLEKEAEPPTAEPQVPDSEPLNLEGIEVEKEKEKEKEEEEQVMLEVEPQIPNATENSSKTPTPIAFTKASIDSLNKDDLKRKQPLEVDLSSSEEEPPLKRPKLVTTTDLEKEVGKLAAQMLELKNEEIGDLRAQVAMLREQLALVFERMNNDQTSLSNFISHQIRMENARNQAEQKEIQEFMAQHEKNTTS